MTFKELNSYLSKELINEWNDEKLHQEAKRLAYNKALDDAIKQCYNGTYNDEWIKEAIESLKIKAL